MKNSYVKSNSTRLRLPLVFLHLVTLKIFNRKLEIEFYDRKNLRTFCINKSERDFETG